MIPPEEVERLKGNPKLQILSQAAPGTGWQLMINTTQAPLDDVKVRQALEYAVNQEDIVKVLFKGALAPSHSPLAKGTIGYDESISKMLASTRRSRRHCWKRPAGRQAATASARRTGRSSTSRSTSSAQAFRRCRSRWPNLYRRSFETSGSSWRSSRPTRQPSSRS